MSAALAIPIDAAASTTAAVKILKGFTGSLRVELRTPTNAAIASAPLAVELLMRSRRVSVRRRLARQSADYACRSEAAQCLGAPCHRPMTDRRQFDDGAID